MTSQTATLSLADLKSFHDDGYVVVRGAFACEGALAMQADWWAELARVHGVLRDDHTTWRQPPRDLRGAKQSPIQHKIVTGHVRGVIDDLLGAGTWPAPKHWGRVLTTFPHPGEWGVPADMWHWDSPCGWHRNSLSGLLVASFIGSVASRSGGTLILSGSPRLLMSHDAVLERRGWRGDAAQSREAFFRTHPWLEALARQAVTSEEQMTTLMQAEARIDGVTVRVVELTGEPGDMVFCHPCIIHRAAPNHGAQPRFMRIAGIRSHEGQARLRPQTK